MGKVLPMKGGCACETIRYECSADPVFTFFCRCRDCQRATGGPFAANVWFPTPAFKFTRGKPRSHVVTAHSGEPSRHEFCENCGSPIGQLADAYPDIRGIRAASLDDPSLLKPVAHVWVTNLLPWDKLDPSLRQFDRNVSHDEMSEIIGLGSD